MPSIPVQPRAKRTQEKLLQALEKLLKTSDFRQITVADIARAANVSVGSVYGHFKDKDEFLATLLERRRQLVEDRIEKRVDVPGVEKDAEFPDLISALRAAVRAAIAQIKNDAHILRALALLDAPTADTERDAAILRNAQLCTEQLLEKFEDEITAMDVPSAAKTVNWVLNNLFYRKAVGRISAAAPDFDLPEDQHESVVSKMLYGVLTDNR